MKKKVLVIPLTVVMICFVIPTVIQTASASYITDQWQWIDGVKQERCTYRAWHEANSRLGVSLPDNWGNGGSWAANARAAGYTVDKTPSADSIVCWSGGEYGHVAYVTGVDTTNIYIVEGGINPSSSYPNYWYRETSFKVSNQNRWSGFSLEGYIHLGPSGPSPVNPGDTFYAYITNPSTGKYFTNVNNNIEGRNASNDSTQIWKFVRQSDGTYYIQNNYNFSFMDVNSLSGELGANVYLNGVYTGNTNQRFYIYFEGNHYYFAPAYGGYHLDMSAATYNLEIWGDGFGSGPQAFDIIKIDPVNMGDVFYASIKNTTTGKYLTNVNNDIQGRDASGDSTQIWKFVHQSDGTYYIQNNNGFQFMDVNSLTGEYGANVYCAGTYTGNTNQRFRIYHVNGHYYFEPAYGGFHLDMSASTYNLEIWGDGFDVGPQAFDIIKIDPVNMGDVFYASIKNTTTGKYLTNVNNDIQGRDASGDSTQIWKFVRQSDGTYYIQNNNGFQFMDVNSLTGEYGANVYCAGTYTGNTNQRFRIYHVNGHYYFEPAYGGFHLDMSASTYNLEIWGDGFDVGPQAFDISKIEPVNIGDEFFAKIRNTISGKYFTNVDNDVQGRDDSRNSTQKWKFVRQSDNSYCIQSMFNNTYMDVNSLSGEYGANVYLYPSYTGNANQRFNIYYVNELYFLAPAYGGYHLDMSATTYNLEIWGDGFDVGPQSFDIIIEQKEDIVIEATPDNNTFTAHLTGATPGDHVFFAAYKDSRMVDIQCAAYQGEDLTFTPGADYDKVKIMLLDSSFRPLCPAWESP